MMRLSELSVDSIVSPSWSPNQMDAGMANRLRRSIERYGMVEPLVVRRREDGRYEIVGGAHRLAASKAMSAEKIQCVIVEADDAEARLLAQALNHISGEDNAGRSAELVRHLLATMPQSEILAILPETEDSLQALARLGKGDMAAHMREWEEGRKDRLKRFQAWLTPEQMREVQDVLSPFLQNDSHVNGDNPNRKGMALYRLCMAYKEVTGCQP